MSTVFLTSLNTGDGPGLGSTPPDDGSDTPVLTWSDTPAPGPSPCLLPIVARLVSTRTSPPVRVDPPTRSVTQEHTTSPRAVSTVLGVPAPVVVEP